MLTSTPAARLTWYPGSILPYASLWHTVLRVAALNGLRSGELPDWPAALGATGQRPRSLYPLHNARAAVNTDALASALGEAPAVFTGSHFSALAPWLRFAVTPGFRLCVPCLAEGYHSALFSLRLLSACPIHGTPLLAQCHCGQPFRDRLAPADFARAGSCACYRLALFTRETCRCPTLPASLAGALAPVSNWLGQLSGLIKPAPWRELARRVDNNPAWLGLLFECSASLGLAWPACFEKPRQATHLMLTVEASAPRLAADKHAAAPAMPMPVRSSYWTDSPATWTYRAMSRHLRRHVVRRQWTQGTRLLGARADPPRLARLLRTDPSAMAALAEMLWTLRMEPEAHARRWPYQKPVVPGRRPVARPARTGQHGARPRRAAGRALPFGCSGMALDRIPRGRTCDGDAVARGAGPGQRDGKRQPCRLEPCRRQCKPVRLVSASPARRQPAVQRSERRHARMV